MGRTEKLVRFVGSEAGGLRCECGEKLAHYEFVERKDEEEKRKKILCCTRDSCVNSAKMSAKIHKAKLVAA